MPFIGWLVGGRFSKYVVKFDHWIAFILLGIIGGKMLFEAFKKEEECEVAATENSDGSIGLKVLLVLAVATSIDALAVGIGFAFLKVDILSVVLLIGIVTLTISFIGVVMGRKLGCLFQKKAEIFGGLILVLIGLKILLEHTGITSMLLAMFR
jgi:putative Mn2+ efflux pump MntP